MKLSGLAKNRPEHCHRHLQGKDSAVQLDSDELFGQIVSIPARGRARVEQNKETRKID